MLFFFVSLTGYINTQRPPVWPPSNGFPRGSPRPFPQGASQGLRLRRGASGCRPARKPPCPPRAPEIPACPPDEPAAGGQGGRPHPEEGRLHRAGWGGGNRPERSTGNQGPKLGWGRGHVRRGPGNAQFLTPGSALRCCGEGECLSDKKTPARPTDPSAGVGAGT